MDMMTLYFMETMDVHWEKCPYNLFWCQLNPNLLDDPRLECRLQTRFGVLRTDITGVYIIWAGIDNRTILKVGSGIIKSRLKAHLNDPKVQTYKSEGLYTTWARITPSFKPDGKLDDRERGVERYLGWLLKPVLAERFPQNRDPIRVNPPMWDNPFRVKSSLAQILAEDNNTFRAKSSLAEMLAEGNNPFRA